MHGTMNIKKKMITNMFRLLPTLLVIFYNKLTLKVGYLWYSVSECFPRDSLVYLTVSTEARWFRPDIFVDCERSTA